MTEFDKRVAELKEQLANVPKLLDKSRPQRVKESRNSLFYMVKTYFQHHIGDTKKETSYFRNYIHQNIDKIIKEHKTALFTAYRGAAKTTTITNFFVLWEVIKKTRKYIVIISASNTLAVSILELIKTELEDNINLKSDFNIEIVTSRVNDIIVKVDGELLKIEAFGAGAKLRGTRFLSYRPDLIILDDIENDENVLSKAYRDKLENWYKKAVKKLPGMKTKYNIIIVGTILHYDSVLSRIKENTYNINFPLVREFADDYKSWVLDDNSLDIEDIYEEYKEDKASFMQERQNIPISSDELLFGKYKTYELMPKCDFYSIALDPSMGKKNGDYFAIAILGFKKDENRFYAKVYGYKQNPMYLIPKILKLYMHYDSVARTIISVETIAYQEFFKDVLKKEASKVGIFLNIKEYKNSVSKDLRLQGLAPLIQDETILIDINDDLLIEEMMTYPKSPHDDLLDALEMAYRNFKSGGRVDYKMIERVKKDFTLKSKYAN